jgi:hypothetical protein
LKKDCLYRGTKIYPPHCNEKSEEIFPDIKKCLKKVFFGKSYNLMLIGGKKAGKTHTLLGNTADPGIIFYIA